MVRVRLASLALALGLTLVSGCCWHWDFPLINRLKCHHPCSCTGVGSPPPIMDGPMLGPTDQVIMPPPPVAPPPRVVPIPQANPMPYTPG